MKIHDLSAQHIFPSKQYTTYERKLVNTKPVKLCQQYHITAHSLTL